MPTVYKTNKGHALTPNNASQVTISDSLYNFIQAQNQNIVTFETITQTYKPTIPDIPMIDNLRVLPKARNGYNQNITRLNKAKKLLGANAVTGPIRKSNPTTYHAKKADLFELVFHVSWGLESLERESQERYHITTRQILKSLLYPFDLTLIHAYYQDDETYLPHLQKYFAINKMPSATKSVHIIQKQKDPRLNMITITQPKAKTLVDKTIELAMIELTDDQKETLINQLAKLPFNVSAESQDEKLEEIATLIETIEDYVEKEEITIDNAERMEAVMYEGIPSEETSAFYGSRYYAIEDMMLDQLY